MNRNEIMMILGIIFAEAGGFHDNLILIIIGAILEGSVKSVSDSGSVKNRRMIKDNNQVKKISFY